MLFNKTITEQNEQCATFYIRAGLLISQLPPRYWLKYYDQRCINYWISTRPARLATGISFGLALLPKG
jgi:hypothetical protein